MWGVTAQSTTASSRGRKHGTCMVKRSLISLSGGFASSFLVEIFAGLRLATKECANGRQLESQMGRGDGIIALAGENLG